jgi:hypothetical protein
MLLTSAVNDIKECELQLSDVKQEFNRLSDGALERLLITGVAQQRKIAREVLRLRAQLNSKKETVIVYSRILDKMAQSESDVADSHQSEGMISTMESDENFSEAAGVDIDNVSSGRSRNAPTGQENVLSLDSFFNRPIEIYKTTIPMSTSWSVVLNVWDIYSKLPSIRAKLRNYAYFRGNLKVRISVSGTPFHYGRILASYQPFDQYNETLQYWEDAFGVNTAFRPMRMNYLSQATGSVVIDVTENKPVEIECPFISTKPMHRLFNTSSTAVIGSSTSFDDFEEAGSLYLCALNNIESVSSSPSSVYLQVYAYADDVQLGTSTATQIQITTESAEIKKKKGKKDERVIGPIENIASRLFDISSALSTVPFIEPYATASSMFFAGLSKVSAIFGWSKPVLIREPAWVRSQPFANGALTIGYDQSERIVLDPLQELTVDPHIVGCDSDELIISGLANRLTYFNFFDWAHDSVPLTDQIWSCSVTPNLVTFIAAEGLNWVSPTTMAFAVQPFMYWRGDIIFRFEVVCSAFHRGKIAVYYEPNPAQHSLISASISLNKQYIKVIDIQETQAFEVRINWASYRPWLLVGGAATGPTWSDPTTVASSFGYANGYIGVVPFTELQSPDNSDVQVNVYVRAENLAVNGLTGANMPNQRKIFSEEELKLGAIAESGTCNISSELTILDLNLSTASYNGLCEDYFGEQPLSFRALLKRFVYSNQISIAADTNTTYRTMQLTNQILPINLLPYGTSTPITVNNLFSYLRYAYLGVKGGIRVRVRPSNNVVIGNYSWVKAGLLPPSTAFVNSTAWVAGASYINAARLEGMTTFMPHINAGLCFELPYYSNNLFQISCSDTYQDGGDPTKDTMSYNYFRNYVVVCETFASVPVTGAMDIEKAAAEDFTLMRFLGAPAYTSIPAS